MILFSVVDRLKNKPVIRYVVVGGLSYLIELACIYLFITLGASPLGAIAISFWVGLVVSFLMQKLIAFNNKKRSPRALAGQSLAYGLLVLLNYVFTLGVVYIGASLLGAYLARTVALIITTVWNYLIYSKIIFRTN